MRRKHALHTDHRDEYWDIATAVRITPSFVVDPHHLGVVCARRHSTGWFISARVRAGMSDADRGVFDDYVALRVHALLSDGPTGWTPAGPAEWTAAASTRVDVNAAAQVPDSVPPHWSRSTNRARTR